MTWRWPWDVLADAVREAGYTRANARNCEAWAEDTENRNIAAALYTLKPAPPPDPELPPQEGEQVLVCPGCRESKPALSISLLRRWVRRKSRWVSVVDGERVVCQGCGLTYCIDYQLGTFRGDYEQIAQSGMAVRGPSPSIAQTRTAGSEQDLGRSLPPLPRERPSI